MIILLAVLIFGMVDSKPSNVSGSVCKLTSSPPNPDSLCCGVDSTSTPRIVGGQEASLRQYPWLALIEYRLLRSSSIQTRCGGSLISGRWVLTAAHCVQGDVLSDSTPVNVRLGDHDRDHEGPDCVFEEGRRDCNDGAVRIPIQRAIVHPRYNSVPFANDIALIKLKTIAPFTEFIRPICLPTSDITVGASASLVLHAAGWGVMQQTLVAGQYQNIGSKVKRHVDLPYMTPKQCMKRWGSVRKTQVCAGGEAGKDSCMGDSGGPLMHEHGDLYEVVGVVSFGNAAPCGKRDMPGVYTKVIEYGAWIKKYVA